MAKSPSIRRQIRATFRSDSNPPDMPISADKSVTFRRRFPRLGSQFQTRIRKSHEPLERPSPDLMSSEFPFISEEEAQARDLEPKSEYFVFWRNFLECGGLGIVFDADCFDDLRNCKS